MTSAPDLRRIAVLPTPAIHAADMRWGHSEAVTFGPDVELDTIGPGDRIAIVGPSGSGKTTLLLTLAGLLAPVHGSVSVTDIDGSASNLPPESFVRFFPSDGHIFATSVRENLLVSRGDADYPMVLGALQKVGLDEWVAGLPNGIDTVLDSGGDALSAGQRRRVLLARALINPAPVLLLDEPCEHLDRTESDRIHRALLDPDSGLIDPGRTVIVVTHRLPADTHADRILDLGCPRRQATSRSRARVNSVV